MHRAPLDELGHEPAPIFDELDTVLAHPDPKEAKDSRRIIRLEHVPREADRLLAYVSARPIEMSEDRIKRIEDMPHVEPRSLFHCASLGAAPASAMRSGARERLTVTEYSSPHAGRRRPQPASARPRTSRSMNVGMLGGLIEITG